MIRVTDLVMTIMMILYLMRMMIIYFKIVALLLIGIEIIT